MFYQAFIGSDIIPIVFTVKARVSSATVNLLVDFDRAEILNMKGDKRHLERIVFSFEIHIYLEVLTNKFSGNRNVYGPRCLSGWTTWQSQRYWAVNEGTLVIAKGPDVLPDHLKRVQQSRQSRLPHGKDWYSSMETETVKLLKALPNMLWKVMPMVVVATKYSQGKRTSETPIPWHPMGLNLDFIIL